jgi:hypothetical protein
MIGAFVGELWGHWFNDFICIRYIRSHGGMWLPEVRLWGTYLPTLVGFVGLVLLGQTLQHTLHWIAMLFSFAFSVFAMIAGTTAVSAYCLDTFPSHSALVSSLINFWRYVPCFAHSQQPLMCWQDYRWLLRRLLPAQVDSFGRASGGVRHTGHAFVACFSWCSADAGDGKEVASITSASESRELEAVDRERAYFAPRHKACGASIH